MIRIVVPVSFFGTVLGLTGLGNDWRTAAKIWVLPSWIGEAVMTIAIIVWTLLMVLYAVKWIWYQQDALSEVGHPIQGCFVALVPISTMLVGIALLEQLKAVGTILCAVGAVSSLVFGVWRQGELWMGGRHSNTTTPVLYLPTVAGNFVLAIAMGVLGMRPWGQLFFGAGVLSWLAMESVVLQRMLVDDPLSIAQRPLWGIQLAPPAVGLVAYLSISVQPSPTWVAVLLGYALLQAAILLRLVPEILQQPFSASYWAVTFGVSALALATERLVEQGDAGPAAALAPWLFIAANVVIGLIAFKSIALLRRAQLIAATPATPLV